MAKKRMLPYDEFVQKMIDVSDLIEDEAEYARQWDKKREAGEGAGTQFDAEKSVETWILFMEYYLAEARKAAVGSFDKTEALKNIRKVAGLAMTCMIHNETPPREEKE